MPHEFNGHYLYSSLMTQQMIIKCKVFDLTNHSALITSLDVMDSINETADFWVLLGTAMPWVSSPWVCTHCQRCRGPLLSFGHAVSEGSWPWTGSTVVPKPGCWAHGSIWGVAQPGTQRHLGLDVSVFNLSKILSAVSRLSLLAGAAVTLT